MCRRIFSVVGMSFIAMLLLSTVGVAYEVNAVAPGLRAAYFASTAGPTASGRTKVRIAEPLPQASTRIAARLDESMDSHARTGSRPEGFSQPDAVSEVGLPPELQQVLATSFPQARPGSITNDAGDAETLVAADRPMQEESRLQTLLTPQDAMKADGSFPGGPETEYRHLEIEVSHSQHELKLLRSSPFRQREILYECRVGLGSREFPTPVGVYFITHIYDDDPWWIPPANRPWAWGQAPSRKVYGGIMAPLLKKRILPFKKKAADSEDFVAELVRLDDDGYRFHGTNAPRSIGFNESHGCVRMRPDDVKKVAALIKENVGTVATPEPLATENGTYVVLKAPVRLNLIK